ncbi:hypothetical protein LFWB_6510 [Candidatus Phytoplasma luffae]|uniref:Uncharacterized protein n=1 Tax=Loofah witches'-broom phytoplasma TaxID=35773 RepID=A0A975FK09_LOWBP|nr:hypothetical protein [Candidatus Phytoplasma luffae]QTX03212.1 hypothetical protein LFWB_6510 [Candidatus Phytoplasma luffae]
MEYVKKNSLLKKIIIVFLFIIIIINSIGVCFNYIKIKDIKTQVDKYTTNNPKEQYNSLISNIADYYKKLNNIDENINQQYSSTSKVNTESNMYYIDLYAKSEKDKLQDEKTFSNFKKYKEIANDQNIKLLIDKFLLCCEELKKYQKKLEDEIETETLKNGSVAKIKEIINNKQNVMDNLNFGRCYLNYYCGILDLFFDILPELDNLSKSEDITKYQKLILRKIKEETLNNKGLTQQLKKVLDSPTGRDIPKLFHTIFNTN